MKERIQPHIMCVLGDVAKLVLLPGDQKRVGRIPPFFDEARNIAEHRDMRLIRER